jgi:hypothetical protein
MTQRIALGAIGVALLAVSGLVAGGALKSGTPVGKKIPGPFHPLNVTGAQAGQKFCLV